MTKVTTSRNAQYPKRQPAMVAPQFATRQVKKCSNLFTIYGSKDGSGSMASVSCADRPLRLVRAVCFLVLFSASGSGMMAQTPTSMGSSEASAPNI